MEQSPSGFTTPLALIEQSPTAVRVSKHLRIFLSDDFSNHAEARRYTETFNNRRGQSLDGGYRPVLVISSIEEANFDENVQKVAAFILRNRIAVLNIAGHRESTAGTPGFYKAVRAILEASFARVHSKVALATIQQRLVELDGDTTPPSSKFVRKFPKVRPFVVHSKKEKYDVYVGRPSEFGNPFKIGPDGDREDVCRKFEEWAREDAAYLTAIKAKLRGKVLGCFCAPLKCHAETLAQIANYEN